MKILVLAAFIAAVSSGRLSGSKNAKQELGDQSQWPWQVGQLYRYDVEAQNLAHYEEGASAGNSFKARFIIRVKAPGYLQAKLENPQNAQVNQVLEHSEPMPDDLKYEPVPKLEMPFNVYYDSGRVLSLSLPSSVPLAQENLLKGLIGALQVDLTTHRNVRSSLDTYDKESQQGLFRKMETDVTGDCETLYSVSPVAPEWRRELPNFATAEEPIEITKSKNYGHCHHRVDYHFGVPEGAEWTGTAHKPGKEQFIKRAMVSRILVGHNGPIYKSETISTVNVHPHVYGNKKAEVHSKVNILLISQEQDSEPEWPQPEGVREIKSLLYTLTHKQVAIDENSSSSSSSSESDEAHVNVESYNRVRRSARPKSVVAINKVIIKKRSEESSSSSSSESASAYVNEEIPKSNEPPYSALYMNPQPHGDKKQNPMHAQKLIQEIAQQLQNPNNMPKSDLLSKFNILVRVIASMSYGQLSQTSRSIEIAKSSNDNVKSDMWMIYRDAVAQAGTQPAFQQIKSWILTKKMEGEEAAEVVASLVQSLRYPTKESMTQFFELAVSPEVSNQMLLNTTALIAATKYINMGQVNNETAHRRYPTHMYGRLSDKHDRFVELDILPRLSSELKQAIEQGDSHKSQVYIMAIGNLGHSAILDIFAPYLEGKITVSTYLRTRMVESLRVLAEQRDRRVRAALYSILKNTAEPYEVRVAAIFNIFMGRPTSAMMQAMAQMTNEDPSTEVRAALKSTIESVANVKHPRFFENARTAEAVKDMLTKEEFGLYHSKKNVEQHSDDDDDFGIITVLTRIRSKDSWFPKSYKYSWNTRYGWDQKTEFGAAVSSGQKVFNAFFDEVFQNSKKPDNSQSSHKYSARKISEILNIQSHDDEPLEASFYLNVMNQQRYFTFNEEDIKDLGVKTGQYFSDLMKGVNKHYSKTVIRNQVSVMFPIASGMPFIYKYKEPTLVHVLSNTKGKVDLKDRDDYEAVVALDKELLYTFAQNYDGNVGFLDTLSNHHSSVGLVGKFQLHIPIRIHYEAKSGEIKLKVSPKEPEQDSTIFHYSIWPYSSNQKKDTLVTYSLDPNTKVITRPNKVVSVDYKFGQQTGQSFQLQGYSYSKDYRNIANYLKSDDYLSNIITAFKQRDIAQTHFNLRYLGKQSKSKGATITAVFDTLYNQKNEGEMPSTATNVQDVSPNSPSRREELAKRVSAGIQAARVDVFDLGVQFESPDKLEYAYTSAIGRSQVDPKVQYAYFISRNTAQGANQANAVGTFYKPQISLMNFREAVQKEFNMNFDIDISYNQKDNMHIHGVMERSKKYSEELQKHSLGQQCVREMETGNYQQRACHEAIIMAHAPDSFKFTVTYKDFNPMLKHALEQVYRTAQRLGLKHSETNEQRANPAGRIDLNIDASYLSHTLNIDLKSVNGESIWNNVRIPESTAVLLASYWPIKPYERLLNHYTAHQYLPYCSVDSNQVRTFSNRNYGYKLTNSWHVVLHDDRSQSNEALVVLARSPNENQQEFYISYRSHTGKELEIEVQPSPASQKNPVVKVKTNAKKISEGDLTTYWDEIDETPILEYYTNNGVLVLNIRENRLRVLYDGSRLVSLAKQGRNNIRGICGYMSGETRDDYLTPNGLIDQPELYGASYVLIDDESDPKDQARHNEAKQKAYQPQSRDTVILRSDEEWKKEMQANYEKWGSQIIYNARNYLKEKKPCDVLPQVQSFENKGEICITTSPLPACQSHCSGDGYTIQSAQVVCKSKFDLQFRSYRDQIRQGQNPRVSGASRLTQYRVPTSCNA